MADEDNGESVMELLILLEEEEARFYELCGQRFPAQCDFWMALARVESEHARFLRDIAADPKEASVFVARRNFATEPMTALLSAMKKNCATLQSTPVTQVWALTVAQGIENSIPENKILNPVPGDPDATVQTIRRINSETQSHCVLIERALAALQK